MQVQREGPRGGRGVSEWRQGLTIEHTIAVSVEVAEDALEGLGTLGRKVACGEVEDRLQRVGHHHLPRPHERVSACGTDWLIDCLID